MQQVLISTLLTALTGGFCIWLLSRLAGRYCIIDAFWGPGFAVLATVTARMCPPDRWGTAQTVAFTATCLWAARLGIYLANRILRDPHEDRRYAAMAARYGPGFRWSSLVIVFLLQAVIMWFVALPVTIGCAGILPQRSVLILIPGGLLWAIGVFFEAVGDWQLARFRAQPDSAGKVLDSGLWGLTRHPNYFGDFCVWWGLWLMSYSAGAPGWTMISPLAMAFFLLRVSGVTLLEKDIGERRPGYVEYIRRTNAFFPGPPADVSKRD